VIQVKLVITTALIAAARKLIIFDFSKTPLQRCSAWQPAIFSLGICYWIIRRMNR